MELNPSQNPHICLSVITGWKEEFHEQGISEEDIAEAVREIGEIIETEKRRPDLEGIKEEHTTKREDTAKLSSGVFQGGVGS